MYTAIQIMTLVFLWVVKSIKEIAIFFPIVLMLLPPIRQSLKFLFTEAELDAVIIIKNKNLLLHIFIWIYALFCSLTMKPAQSLPN